jgi:hypothetical protein
MSFDFGDASAGSATVTLKRSPSPWRSAIASARPAKPPPAIRTSIGLPFVTRNDPDNAPVVTYGPDRRKSSTARAA